MESPEESRYVGFFEEAAGMESLREPEKRSDFELRVR
jgi:hypothetical protein